MCVLKDKFLSIIYKNCYDYIKENIENNNNRLIE